MPTQVVFEFLKGQPIYYSGETIEGKVRFKITKDKKVQSMSINFVGECKVQWEERVKVMQSNRKSYFAKNELAGNQILTEECILLYSDGIVPAGTYIYDFDFKVGSGCFTSCEGKYGYIRYEVFLLIERDSKYSNEFSKAITVIKPLDLNTNPFYKEPLVSEIADASCCWPNSIRKTFCVLSTEFGAYAPGQFIAFKLALCNRSRKKIEGFHIDLIKKITFISKHPKISDIFTETKLASRFFRVQRSTEYTITNGFIIPVTAPTICKRDMFIVEYFLRAHAITPCFFRSDLKAEVKIIIGTLPLRESLFEDQFDDPSQQQQGLPKEGDRGGAANLPINNYEILPPTFELDLPLEQPFEELNSSQASQIVGFRPLYPVYTTTAKEIAKINNS